MMIIFQYFVAVQQIFRIYSINFLRFFATTLYIYIIHISSTIPETLTQGSGFQTKEQENAFTNINKGNETFQSKQKTHSRKYFS